MHSEHFSERELACQHCGRSGVTAELVAALEELRAKLGSPIHINSGYRCPRHPLSIERPGSKHALGQAADIRVPGVPLDQLYRTIVQHVPAIRGIGVDPIAGYIRVDVREKRALWTYAGHSVIAWNGDWTRLPKAA